MSSCCSCRFFYSVQGHLIHVSQSPGAYSNSSPWWTSWNQWLFAQCWCFPTNWGVPAWAIPVLSPLSVNSSSRWGEISCILATAPHPVTGHHPLTSLGDVYVDWWDLLSVFSRTNNPSSPHKGDAPDPKLILWFPLHLSSSSSCSEEPWTGHSTPDVYFHMSLCCKILFNGSKSALPTIFKGYLSLYIDLNTLLYLPRETDC